MIIIVRMLIICLLFSVGLIAESYLDTRELVVDHERVVFKNGNLGIGVSNPTHSLVVSGDIKVASLGTSQVNRVTPFIISGGDSSSLSLGYDVVYNSSSSGLFLTVVRKSDHFVISTQNYSTDSTPFDAAALATALNNVDDESFGFITGQGNWERFVNTTLKAAFLRVGLVKAAGTTGTVLSKPYAGAFEGADTGAQSLVGYETMFSSASDVPSASVAGFLIEGVLSATGSQFNYLPSHQGVTVAVFIDDRGFIGLGTTEPKARLHVADNLFLEGSDLRIRFYSNQSSPEPGGIRYFNDVADNLRLWFYPSDDWDSSTLSERQEDRIYFGDTDGVTRRFRFDGDGEAYATAWHTGGADFAEWMDHESVSDPGDLIGVNLQTGFVRKYREGDYFIGVHSSNPGFIGNQPLEVDDELDWKSRYTLVGLKGQLVIDMSQVTLREGVVFTLDGKKVGIYLDDGVVYVR